MLERLNVFLGGCGGKGAQDGVIIIIIIRPISPPASAQSSLSSSEALSLSILYGFRQFGPPRHAYMKVQLVKVQTESP